MLSEGREKYFRCLGRSSKVQHQIPVTVLGLGDGSSNRSENLKDWCLQVCSQTSPACKPVASRQPGTLLSKMMGPEKRACGSFVEGKVKVLWLFQEVISGLVVAIPLEIQ